MTGPRWLIQQLIHVGRAKQQWRPAYSTLDEHEARDEYRVRLAGMTRGQLRLISPAGEVILEDTIGKAPRDR